MKENQVNNDASNIEEIESSKKVEVQKSIFPTLEGDKQKDDSPSNIKLIRDVHLEFSVVLGRSKKTVREILSFNNGSIVELNKLADEPLEIYINGKLLAFGEVVVINENFGVRITNILSEEHRIEQL